MRLTLRTLLAYLDNTLAEKDAEAIGEKIKESSFASQVVDRVRSVLRNSQLAAPSPGANGPTDDPNVVGEYLDSTLSAEQAAEVDRTCLESDVHLAEAAACHQVLTMVLGTPADVPQDLRKRVYALGRRSDEQGAAVAGATDPTVVRPAVAPVGLDDSGAYRAASRLDQSADAHSLDKTQDSGKKRKREAAMAGSRPLSASEASEIFGDRIRTSRVVPWLVTLGVAALFLFVLAQAFEPLLESDQLTLDREQPAEVTNPPVTPPVSDGGDDDTGSGEQTATGDDRAAASPAGDVDRNGEDATADEEAPEIETPNAEMEAREDEEPVAPTTPGDGDGAASETPDRADESNQPDATVAMADRSDDDAADATGDPASVSPTPDGDAAQQDVEGIARLASDQSLLLVAGSEDENWQRVDDQSLVPSERTIVCPPLFRVRLTIEEQADLVLVGPARLRIAGTAKQPRIVLQRGRLVVSALSDDLLVDLQLDELSGVLGLPELGDVAAIEVSHFRVPGTDPTNPENSMPVLKIESVVGRLGWSPGDAESLPIETGQRWTRIGSNSAQVVVPEEPVDWVDPPEGNRQTLAQAAREGLRAFLNVDKPVGLALREAVGFRRAEVAALAAQTLLLMGEPDVYFGSTGMLSDASQKSYWADHVAALQARLNEGPEEATEVKQAAVAMNGASADTLFRLLWGYSPEQLKAGADAELVEMLDSPQMSLRVLAIENLRQITGTSLFYKPEQENASRRNSDVKKWEARLRRGDIRWETIPIAR